MNVFQISRKYGETPLYNNDSLSMCYVFHYIYSSILNQSYSVQELLLLNEISLTTVEIMEGISSHFHTKLLEIIYHPCSFWMMVYLVAANV